MIHISEGVTLVPHFRLNNKYDGSTILLASSSVFLRFALGFSFLSAVADRFGLWGAFGEPHVAWGTFARFVAYTGTLNWFLPRAAVPTSRIPRRVSVQVANQGTFGRLSLLGSRRSLSFGQLRRISIQHRSAATIFA